MSELALTLIREAKEKNLKTLDLGNCGLTSETIPEELWELTELEELVLSNEYYNFQDSDIIESNNVGIENEIITLPEQISRLRKLRELYISGPRNQNLSSSTIRSNIDWSPLYNLNHLHLLDCSFQNIDNLSDIARLTTLTHLNCGKNQIRNLSPLSKLSELTHLEIWNNSLTDLSPLTSLKKLVHLNCTWNKLTDLAPLSQLPSLKLLNFSINEITSLAPLLNLTSLSLLNCSNNKLSDLSPLTSLKKLTHLDCRHNQIQDLSPMSNLKLIVSLECSFNQITDLLPLKNLNTLTSLICSENQITDLQPIANLPHLTELICINNPLTSPPMDIANQGIKAIRSYFEALQKSHKNIVNNELKMIILGNSTAGKSSLIEWLQTGKITLNRNSTHGMEAKQWEPKFPIKEVENVRVKVLDFGGQEFYHDTHHLFLNNSTLYVVLWDNLHNQYGNLKTEITIDNKTQTVQLEHFPITYWLGCIQHFTNPPTTYHIPQNAPTLLIQNRIDEENNGIEWLEQKQLKTNFPFIFDFCATSLLTGQRTTILRELIKELCQQSPVVGHPLPDYWLDIREKLTKKRQKNMTYKQFGEFCLDIRQDMTPDEIMTLCLFLRNTFYLQCFFENEGNPQPDELIITEPTWLTQNIYKILSLELGQKKGELNKDHIRKALGKTSFDKDCQVILDLMARFKLIFPKANESDVWIASQYLPEKPSREVEFFISSYKPFFRFVYKGFLHRRVILELFMAFAEEIAVDEIYWKYGIVLKNGQEQLVIQFNRNYNMIELLADSDALPNTVFVQNIVKKIRAINRNYQPDESVSLDRVNFVPVSEIKNAYEGRLSEFQYSSIRFRSADFQPFMIYTGITDLKYRNMRVFISYSKADKVLRDELETHLSSLQREGMVQVWHDGMLEPGKEWDKEIKNELERADVILLLISANFIGTNFIWDIELRKASERAGAGTARVVPIILRDCLWEGLSFSKFQALPDKAEPIDSEHRYIRDAAWKKVMTKLKVIIETMSL